MRFPGRRKYKRKSKWVTGPAVCIPPDPALDNLLASWSAKHFGHSDPGLMTDKLKPGDMCKMGALESGPLLASAVRSQLLRSRLKMQSASVNITEDETGFERKE